MLSMACSILSWQKSLVFTSRGAWQYMCRCSRFPQCLVAMVVCVGQKGQDFIVSWDMWGSFFQFFGIDMLVEFFMVSGRLSRQCIQIRLGREGFLYMVRVQHVVVNLMMCLRFDSWTICVSSNPTKLRRRKKRPCFTRCCSLRSSSSSSSA